MTVTPQKWKTNDKHMRASSFLILGVSSSWLREEEQGRVQPVLSSCRETVCFSLRIQSRGSKHTTLLGFAQQSTEPTELHRAPRIWCETNDPRAEKGYRPCPQVYKVAELATPPANMETHSSPGHP